MLKRLMGEDAATAAPTAALAVFGKHPGWNDHLDDQGLSTAALIEFKRVLYVEGIGRNIDTGAWEALPPEKRLDAFDHALLVQDRWGVIVGRMWASSDGRGRKHYPMVAAAHLSGVSRDDAIRLAWPHVMQAEAACRQTSDAGEAIAAAAAAREALIADLAIAAPAPPPAVADVEAVRRLRDRPVFAEPDRWPRVLYRFEDELNARRWRVGEMDGRAAVAPVAELRVPAAGDDAPASLGHWGAFASAIAGSTPAYLFHPHGQSWVDLFLGQPTPQQLFALRATTARLPLVTDIPFTLDPAFAQQARQWP